MRGGKITTAFRAGSVTVNFRVGHVDTMPRCAVCGRALCGHTDAEFAGLQTPIGAFPHPGRPGAVSVDRAAPDKFQDLLHNTEVA